MYLIIIALNPKVSTLPSVIKIYDYVRRKWENVKKFGYHCVLRRHNRFELCSFRITFHRINEFMNKWYIMSYSRK
jgi:hypothetical protein